MMAFAFERVENIVVERENACYMLFLLVSQSF